LARARTGSRKPRAADHRRPRFWLTSNRAFVVAGVEIGDRLDARLGGGGAKRLEQRPSHPRRLDPPFAADPVVSARPEEIILMALEPGQHVVPAPAGEAELAPMIIVGGLAAHIDHGVDGGRAADHLAAGIVQAAAVEAFLRLGLEHPVRTRIADGEEIADRDVVPDPVVAPAGLQQQHAGIRRGRQPVRQHAAGRAGTDDDVIVIAVDGLVVHGGNVRWREGRCNNAQSVARIERSEIRVSIEAWSGTVGISLQAEHSSSP
jgi:hypothetical protein